MKSLEMRCIDWNVRVLYNLCRNRDDGYRCSVDSLACCRHYFDVEGRFVVEMSFLGTPAWVLRDGGVIHEAAHAAFRLAHYLSTFNKVEVLPTEEVIAEVTSGLAQVGLHWLESRCKADDKLYTKILNEMQGYVGRIQ